MKILIVIFLFICSLSTNLSIYDFKINSISGELVDFSKYEGKALLIVNTASKCGYTPQYADLQKLNDLHGDKVTILGFPANNFKGQEPGSNAEIATFCTKNYGVTFQMFEKVSVVGIDSHPIFNLLKEKTGKKPTWNFCKYLVKPDGKVTFFNSKVNPMSKEILSEL